MKAQEILMYLLTFNTAVTLIGTLNIFFVENYKVALIATITTVIIGGFIGTLVIYAVVNYFTGGTTQRSPQGYIYYLYGFAYLGTLFNTTRIFISIENQLPNIPEVRVFSGLLITAFDIFCGWAFLTGISQMITGGWRQMK